MNPETRSGNLTLDLSDGHLPSFMLTPRSNQKHLPKKHNKMKREYKNFNEDEFKKKYDSVDWDATINLSKNDPNIATENFMSKINELLDEVAPFT